MLCKLLVRAIRLSPKNSPNPVEAIQFILIHETFLPPLAGPLILLLTLLLLLLLSSSASLLHVVVIAGAVRGGGRMRHMYQQPTDLCGGMLVSWFDVSWLPCCFT